MQPEAMFTNHSCFASFQSLIDTLVPLDSNLHFELSEWPALGKRHTSFGIVLLLSLPLKDQEV